MNPDNEMIVEQCKGCGHVVTINFAPPSSAHPEEFVCNVKWRPEAMWINGKRCPFATHIIRVEKQPEKQKDPIKASKAKAKGR